jgi:hypothetical protein
MTEGSIEEGYRAGLESVAGAAPLPDEPTPPPEGSGEQCCLGDFAFPRQPVTLAAEGLVSFSGVCTRPAIP